MYRTVFALCCFIFFGIAPSIAFAQSQKGTKPGVNFPQASQFANSKFTYKVIPAPEDTFGYDILNP